MNISNNLCFDSRKVEKDSIFFCIVGENTDGHQYIKQAIEKGASLIYAQEDKKEKINKEILELKVPIIFVPCTKTALANACKEKYKDIMSKISIFAITGTNGKTTTTHLIAKLFSVAFKENIGLMGTLGNKVYSKGVEKEFLGEGSGRTTPQAIELYENFKNLFEKGCKKIVIEVSSHALIQKRIHGCSFDTMMFTNLTQDHLDYHLNMENYFEAKALIFDYTVNNAIINLDDSWAKAFIEKAKVKNLNILTYSIKDPSATIYAKNIKNSTEGISADICFSNECINTNIKLHGIFNLYNILGAIAVGLAKNISLKDCIEIFKTVEATKGRFELVDRPNKNLPSCIIDYAHTPDGLENVLKTAKEILPKGGELICIFGCGGDRDSTKRPIMGKIASTLADKIIITSDNPRSEDPEQIIADILSGISSLNNTEIIIDRAEAINKTIKNAKKEDLILIAGKGHENYQIFKDQTIFFDDKEQVIKAYNSF